MNELELQVIQIKQAVETGSPKGLILSLLNILEGYVVGGEAAQQGVQADGATWESLGAGFVEVEPDHSEGE